MWKKGIFIVVSLCVGISLACLFILRGGSVEPTISPLSTIQSLHVKRPEIIGFLPYWLLGKADKQYERFITDLTYFGLALKEDGSILTHTNPQELEPGFNTLKGDSLSAMLSDLSAKHVSSSLLIISGDDVVIRELLTDPVKHAETMMRDVLPIMKEKKFTDLNLDIETFMEASASDRGKFTEFVKTVKDILISSHAGTLTIDLIPIALVRPKLYDAAELGKLADRIVLMTYDYHYSGSVTSGAVAPIGGAGETIEYDVKTAVEEALKVLPKEKILLGVPLYGYQWETISEASESATIPGGSSTASVRRIAEKLRACTECITGIDPYSEEPYLIYKEGDVYNQIYYEDETSMSKKIALAKKYELGGVALWALGYEDDTLLKPLEAYKKTFSLSW